MQAEPVAMGAVVVVVSVWRFQVYLVCIGFCLYGRRTVDGRASRGGERSTIHAEIMK